MVREQPSSGQQQAKNVVKTFYNSLNDHLNKTGFGEYSTFLNWGYVSNGNPEFAKIPLPQRCLNKNCLKLILELVGDCDLNDCDILEVGCGRGGNIQALNRFFSAKSFTGLDITPASIAFCKEQLENQHCHFLEGDAESLPFGDASFDIVINVESSNAYPNIFKFYDQVSRVLKPRGYFLYTDILKTGQFEDCIQYLQNNGLTLELERDITTNVLLSRKEMAKTQMKSFGLLAPDRSSDEISEAEKDIFDFFLAPEDSHFFQHIQEGRFSYKIFRFRKV